MKSDSSCIFCRIVTREAQASVLYEDEQIMAFMNVRPINEGEFMVIPREHIDHFCDLSDEVACSILVEAQKLSRNLREKLKPQRVGLVVHGFGVPHAHLVVVPQHSPDDITSAKLAHIEDGQIRYSVDRLQEPSRDELDRMAKLLS